MPSSLKEEYKTDIEKNFIDRIATNEIEYTSDEFSDINIRLGTPYLEVCERIKEMDLLPIKNLNIKFSSDHWDFVPLVKDAYEANRSTTFNFANVPESYKDLAKFYIYGTLTINRKIKIPTLSDDFHGLRMFLKYLHNEYIYSIESISIGTIKDYLRARFESGRATKEATFVEYLGIIKSFISFYHAYMTKKKDFRPIIDEIEKLITELNKIVKNDEERKTNNIPNEYFNNFLSFFTKQMYSTTNDVKLRGYACLAVILSQTGLRTSQLVSLKSNAITPVSIMDNTKTAYFMEFTIIKRKGRTVYYEQAKTILNELAYNAYRILEELHKDKREKLGSDFLFCPPDCRKPPLDKTTYNRNILRYCILFGKEIGCVNVTDKYPGLKEVTIEHHESVYRGERKKRDPIYNGYSDDDIISYPHPHQFRVHLCTELYYKNVPLQIIQHYMSHLSEDMSDYYVRREEYSDKEEEYATSILETIIKEGTKPLGAGSDALMKKIDEFIEAGNFNIEKDFDTAVSKIIRRMPVKEKYGGICIKSGPRRDCSKDAKTDEFYCSYNVCPNHFHLYTMADITYNKCQTILKTIKHNKDNGFIRQAEKEQNKLRHVAKTHLLPELNQLKDELQKKGEAWIKEKYPQIASIIDNYDAILKEANSWIA